MSRNTQLLQPNLPDSAMSVPPPYVSLKRRGSPSIESTRDNGTSCKRIREDLDDSARPLAPGHAGSGGKSTILDDLAQELQCSCCAELVYRPVIVSPCQHFFCGSCCALWISNGGTNCPTCRTTSTSVTPSRPLQSILDILLRVDPSRTRVKREREQADEVYKAGSSLRLPTPREPSPTPDINQNVDYAYPCPHCLPENIFGWRCPQPIANPNTDVGSAWPLEGGSPPGHALCGNCETLTAIHAPATTRCDFCMVLFCGIGVQGRCLSAPIASQQPHGMTDIGDLIQSADVYECFDDNTVEAEFMLDYITTQRLTPRQIYREIVNHIKAQPRGFAPLIEDDLFSDMYGVSPSIDANSQTSRNRICRLCATQVLLWGLRDWWIRERRKGLLEERVATRKDCPSGSSCNEQKDLAHSRDFNHIIPPDAPTQEAPIWDPVASDRRAIEDSSGQASQACSNLPSGVDSELSRSFLSRQDFPNDTDTLSF